MFMKVLLWISLSSMLPQSFRLLSLLMARRIATFLLSRQLVMDDYAYLSLVFVGQLRQDHDRMVADALLILIFSIGAIDDVYI